MKKFIYNTLKFISFFLFFVFFLSIINKKLAYREKYFNLEEDTKYVVFGDSHIQYTFNDSIKGLVNLGQSAEMYLYTYYKVENILINNKQLEAIFIDFCNFQIEDSQDSFFWDSDSYLSTRYPVYSPFFKGNEYSLLWNNNPKGFVDAHFKSLFKGFRNFLTEEDVVTDNLMGGYRSLDKTLTDTTRVQNKFNINGRDEIKLSSFNIGKLKDILYICRKNNVKVFLVRSPLHRKWTFLRNENSFKKVLSSEFSKFEFLDFKNFPILDTEFADFEHLNETGASKFSLFFNELLTDGLLTNESKQKFIDLRIKNRIKGL